MLVAQRHSWSRYRIKTSVAALTLIFGSLACAPAGAQIVTSGAVNTHPGTLGIGPGNTDIGLNGLFIGNTGTGSLSVTGGSRLRVGSLSIADGMTAGGNGSVSVSGATTRLEIAGDGLLRRTSQSSAGWRLGHRIPLPGARRHSRRASERFHLSGR